MDSRQIKGPIKVMVGLILLALIVLFLVKSCQNNEGELRMPGPISSTYSSSPSKA